VAENLLIVLELAATWTALRTRRSGHPSRWIAATGVLVGLAALTHQNAILLLAPLGVATVTAARRRLPAAALLVAAAAATIAPWTIRNAVELHRFVPVSDETGITLAGTYNAQSAAQTAIPYRWRFFWKIASDQHLRHTAGRYTEPQLDAKLRAQALHYIGAHPIAPAAAGWHNLTRLLELEGSAAWHASAQAVGLPANVARTGVIAFWVLAVLAIAGAFTARARRMPGWLWAIPLLLTLSVVFINVETPRFRAPVDPYLILPAACAVIAALAALRRGLLLRGAPVGRGRRASELPGGGERVQVGQRLARADSDTRQR
jgi:4-amino-4-deoxy-L-arabinose transferase-like glycosyltransferase